MSKTLKGMLVLALAGTAANSAMAADGQIHFTGEIIAASCEMTTGSGGGTVTDPKNITVDLGSVSKDALANSGGNGNIVAAKNINLVLDCANTSAGLTTVHLSFQPAASGGSGLDAANTRLLKVTGGAAGVGIGLFDQNNQLLDLNNPSTKVTGPLSLVGPGNTTATANLNLRAAYVANGLPTITEGPANGVLPFSLSYE